MAFGQPNGYPATRGQLEQLTQLILDAGHTGFRDARGPLGLTQRQAGGRFTREEADELIALLQAEADGAEQRDSAAVPAPKPLSARSTTALRRIPSETLAAELQRRGWIVVEP